MLTTPFMDDVHRATFGKQKHKNQSPTMARYRTLLRQAVRFQLDDDFIRLVAHASHERDHMETYAGMARLPFDTVWLEWDQLVMLREFEAMGSLNAVVESETFRMMGALITLDKPSTTRWVATEFGDLRDRDVGIVPAMADLVFDPEPGIETVTGSTYWRQPTISRIPGMPKLDFDFSGLTPAQSEEMSIPLEWAYYGAFTKEEERDDGLSLMYPAAIGATMNPWWLALPQFAARAKGYVEHFRSDARERRGVLRHIITALALINSPPVEIMPAPKRTGTYAAGLARHEYLGHKMVRLRVPVQRAREIIHHMLEERAKYARHAVRGHFRVIDSGRGKRVRPCGHRPMEVVDGIGTCEACGHRVRWIDWHERGDASIGYVVHSYEVTAS